MLPMNKKHNYIPEFGNGIFGRDIFSAFFSDGADYTVPAINIKENDKGYEIEVAIPGSGKKDVQVNLEKDTLTISSQNKHEKKESAENYTHREFSYKAFSRSFTVPETVNKEMIRAAHENGVLRIELPKLGKKTLKKAKSIKIS